jgi:hypothetical protein
VGTVRTSESFAVVTPADNVEADVRELLHVDERYTGSLSHDDFYRTTWGAQRAPVDEGGFGVGVSSGWPFGKWGLVLALNNRMDPVNVRKAVAAAKKGEGLFAGRVIFSNSSYTMAPRDVEEVKALLDERASEQRRLRGWLIPSSESTPTQ